MTMTIEQVLSALDEIALERVTVRPCAVCGTEQTLSAMSECGTCGARVCAKCDCACPVAPEDMM